MVETTNTSYVELSVGSVWYDTVDQPHIPVRITNHFSKNIVVVVELRTLDGRVVEKKGPIELKGGKQQELEFIVEAPDKFLVVCKWRRELEKEWSFLKPVEVKA